MTKPMECPECFCEDIGNRWVKNRMLQYHCRDCNWKDEPRIPETKPIVSKKKITVNHFSGYRYEAFDRYGHIRVCSRSYYKKAEAIKEIEKELEQGKTDIHAGPYTIILWPDIIEVEGEIFK